MEHLMSWRWRLEVDGWVRTESMNMNRSVLRIYAVLIWSGRPRLGFHDVRFQARQKEKWRKGNTNREKVEEKVRQLWRESEEFESMNEDEEDSRNVGPESSWNEWKCPWIGWSRNSHLFPMSLTTESWWFWWAWGDEHSCMHARPQLLSFQFKYGEGGLLSPYFLFTLLFTMKFLFRVRNFLQASFWLFLFWVNKSFPFPSFVSCPGSVNRLRLSLLH